MSREVHVGAISPQTLIITSVVEQKDLLMLLNGPFAISRLFFFPDIFPFLLTPVLLASTRGNTRQLMNYSDTLLHHEYPPPNPYWSPFLFHIFYVFTCSFSYCRKHSKAALALEVASVNMGHGLLYGPTVNWHGNCIICYSLYC